MTVLLGRLVAAAALCLASIATDAAAQSAVEITVDDGGGRGVPFAVVWYARGRPAIADSLGQLRVAVRGDSVRLQVRRIGFREFNAVVPIVDGRARASMQPVALLQDTIRVVAAANTPLAQRGFYDRVDRVRRGAIVGEFYPPEEILLRDAARVSDLLRGSRYVRVANTQAGSRVNVPVFLGRGGCGMTIIVDGQQLKGTVEEGVTGDAPQSIVGGRGGGGSAGGLVSVDDLVSGRAVAAIEIYPSTANAPAELQTLGGRGSCGIVAIWTGSAQ